MKFYFLNTCYACPEQYDVYRSNGELCGYIRLRWGMLIAEYPDVNGTCIYKYYFNDDFKGRFDSDEERHEYLKNIAVEFQLTILGDIQTNLNTEDVTYEILTDPRELEEKLKYE